MYDTDDDAPDWGAHHARSRDRKHANKKRRTAADLLKTPAGPTRSGLVLEPTRQQAVVRIGGEELDCLVPSDLVLAPGDEVLVAQGDRNVVKRVHPRRTRLERRDVHNPHVPKVIVANVDWIAIVGAASSPPFRPGLVDRYLAAIHRGGARPIVVVNKVDEPHDPVDLDEWRDLGVDAVACSAATGEGLPALLALLGDGRGAFVGHSGVGKSSLLSALGAAAEAGSLADHGRGRHTTTGSRLHVLPGGAEVIDTPGVRQFAPWDVSDADVWAAFPDLEALAARCEWPSCRHEGDEGCALEEAVLDGVVAPSRLARFQRLRVT